MEAGGYTLSQADCESRVMQIRAASLGADAHCWPSSRDEVWRQTVPHEAEPIGAIAH